MKSKLISLLSIIFLFGCTKKENSSIDISSSEAISVTTFEVKEKIVTIPYYTEGTVISKCNVGISSKITASVESSIIEVGRNVKKGELLLTLKANEIDAKLDATKAQYAKIERDLNRESDLLKKGASTLVIVKDLRDALNIAKAQLEESLTFKSYTNIYSPMDGVIVSKNISVGDLVMMGMKICEIADTKNLQVKANIPSKLSTLINVGEKYRMIANGNSYEVSLDEISPQMDTFTKTKVFKFKIEDSKNFTLGELVKIEIPSETFKALIIPQSCISKLGQIDRVFIVQNGRIIMRIVKLGDKIEGNFYIVKSGLTFGDKAIENPNVGVKEGVKVK